MRVQMVDARPDPARFSLARGTGFEMLPAYVAYRPGRDNGTMRGPKREACAKRLETLDTTPPQSFHPAKDDGPAARLKPGVLARSGLQHNV